MKKLFFALIGCLLTLCLSVVAYAQDVTSAQAGMDRVVADISTINELLSSQERLDRYYLEVNNFYQGKIKRNIFDVVISQMRQLVADNPEFGRRLLNETTGLPSYNIVSDVKTYGRKIESSSWESLVLELFGKPTKLPADIDNKLLAISEQIQSFESTIQGSKKDQGFQRGEFYKSLKKTHAGLIKSIVGHIYYHDTEMISLRSSVDSDMIFYSLESVLKQKVAALSYPQNILSLISSGIPRVSDLLARTDVFPVLMVNLRGVDGPAEPMTASTYKFESFKRPLHAVWKGLWLAECVGGENEKVTPRRWATVAFKDVNNYAVQKNGSFVGFVQELGMQKPGSLRRVYATEFGVPNLKEDILVRDATTNQLHKRKMIDVWIEKAPKNIVRVKSESEAINNAKVIEVLNGSATWNFRRSKGHASEFVFIDQALADFIISSSEKYRMQPAEDYGPGIISDASVPGADKLSVLKNVRWTERAQKAFIFDKNTKAQDIIDRVSKAPDIFEKTSVPQFLERIYQVNVATDPVKIILIVQHFYSDDPEVMEAYRQRLAFDVKTSFEKMKVFEAIYGVGTKKSAAYGKTLAWTADDISRYVSSSQQKISFYDSHAKYISNLVFKQKMIKAYPAIVKLGWDFFRTTPEGKKLVDAVMELDRLDPEASKSATESLFKEISTASKKHQEIILDLAIKYNLLAKLRVEAIKTQGRSYFSFQDAWQYNVSFKYADYLIQSAVKDKDFLFLENVLVSNRDFYLKPESKKLMANLISYVMKSKDKKLILLLAKQNVPKVWASNSSVQARRSLSPETAAFDIWANEMVLKRGYNFSDADDVVEKILSLKIGDKEPSKTATAKRVETKIKNEPPAKTVEKTKTDSVVAQSPAPRVPVVTVATQVVPPAAVPSPVESQVLSPARNSSVDLTQALTNLFAATDMRAVDGIQRQIQMALGKEFNFSKESLDMITDYLRSTTIQNIEGRVYQILALFEIAATTPKVPAEIYKSTQSKARHILQMPDFVDYQQHYAELLKGQAVDPAAPMMCRTVFR